jgi:hypothetical protein
VPGRSATGRAGQIPAILAVAHDRLFRAARSANGRAGARANSRRSIARAGQGPDHALLSSPLDGSRPIALTCDRHPGDRAGRPDSLPVLTLLTGGAGWRAQCPSRRFWPVRAGSLAVIFVIDAVAADVGPQVAGEGEEALQGLPVELGGVRGDVAEPVGLVAVAGQVPQRCGYWLEDGQEPVQLPGQPQPIPR